MDQVKLALPSGRIQKNIFTLINDAGIQISNSSRSYRPKLSIDGFEAKIFRSQNALEMLDLGKRDLVFAGLDWVKELDVDVIELLDTELDPVSIVSASTEDFIELLESAKFSSNSEPIVIASEYQRLSMDWAMKKNIEARVIRSFGTTESFPPEDADCIIDNMATGATIEVANLKVIDILLNSSTRVFSSKQVLDNPSKRQRIEDFVLLLRSVLDGRNRVMVEINVSKDVLSGVAEILPCMRTPTISELYNGAGFVIKAAVSKNEIPRLIPMIRSAGGTDIVVTNLSNVIP